MLYVSRVKVVACNDWRLCVLDTDDGVEELWDFPDLMDVLRHNRSLKLGGVWYAHDGSMHDILVYQVPEFVTRNQAKFKSFYGVDIKTYDRDIRAISGYTKKDITIRLSDFGMTCGDYILRELVLSEGAEATIILDDNIEIAENTFFGIGRNIVFDLRQLTNKTILKLIYSLDLRQDQFIDSDDRKDYYFGLKLLGEIDVAKPTLNKYEIKDMARLERVLMDKYGERFSKFLADGAPTNIFLGTSGSVGLDPYFVSSLKDSIEFVAEGIHMFYLNENYFHSALESRSDTDMRTYELLSRFVNLFGESCEIAHRFSKYILDVATWIVFKVRG